MGGDIMKLYAMSTRTAIVENSADLLTVAPDRVLISSLLFNLLFVFPAIALILGVYITNKKVIKVENVSKGLGIISFFVPIVGIILYFSKKNENKEIATYFVKMSIGGIITYIAMIASFCLAFAIRFLIPLYILNW